MGKSLFTLGAAAFITSTASATVTGLSAQLVGTVSGRDIYSVFVNSNGPNASGMSDILLYMISHQVVDGTMANVQHTDSYVNSFGQAVGNWNPSYTSASTVATSNKWKDSYVTITGRTGGSSWTSLDPSFGSGASNPANPAIPPNAGWYTGQPAIDIVITGGKIKVMQLAVTATPGHAYQYTGKVPVGYKLQGTSSLLYAMNLTYVIGTPIPAPSAVALIGVGGLLGGRRRRVTS